MRVHLRVHQRFLVLVLLIAILGVGAFAQGRGAPSTATNGFYRFNYGVDEVQPISYPAQPIAT